jgi:hypothetical protein
MMFETAEDGAVSGVVSKGGIPSQQIIQTGTQTGAFTVTPIIIGSALYQPAECRHVKQVCVTSKCVRKTAKHLNLKGKHRADTVSLLPALTCDPHPLQNTSRTTQCCSFPK